MKVQGKFGVKPTDLQWWFEMHDRLRWTFARTMPKLPHYYIYRGKNVDPEIYDKGFGVIRAFGDTGKFYSRTQLYLHNHEREIRYWLMSRHHWQSKSLNMATDGKDYGRQDAPATTTPGWSEYDAIAPWWDDIYRDFVDFDKAVLWKLVHQNVSVIKPTLLDIGAGTGATIDAQVAGASETTAIDPSRGMLNDLVVKYPNIRRVFGGTFDDYLQAGGDRAYDLAVASAGSASYLTPQEIRQVPEVARSLAVLSFYDSVPSHRNEMPDTHAEAYRAATELEGAVSMVHGDFVHVVVRGGRRG